MDKNVVGKKISRPGAPIKIMLNVEQIGQRRIWPPTRPNLKILATPLV